MSILKLINEMTEEFKNLKIEKRIEYKEYIDNHINNVQKAYKIFASINWDESVISKDDLILLQNRIIHHDESKYSDEEFEAYRKYFYPINDIEKEESEDEFDEAWKHHYTVNDHHSEFWIKDGIPSEMKISAIAEMICDWQAMSFVKGGSALSYYESIKGTDNDKILAPETRSILETLLIAYDEAVQMTNN